MAGIPIYNSSTVIQEWLKNGGTIDNLLKEWQQLDVNSIIKKIQINDVLLSADNNVINLTEYLPNYNSSLRKMIIDSLEANNEISTKLLKSSSITNDGSISTNSLNVKSIFTYQDKTIDLNKIIDALDQGLTLKILKENEALQSIYMNTSNRNLGKFTSAFGYNNCAGVNAFNILDIVQDTGERTTEIIIDNENTIPAGQVIGTFTLDDVTGLEPYMLYSCNIRFTKKDGENFNPNASIMRQRMNYGRILSIEGNVVKVSNFPSKEDLNINPPEDFYFYPHEDGIQINGVDEEANTFRIISNPELGTRPIGYTCATFGYENVTHSKGSFSAGAGNDSFGSCSTTFGKLNKAGYVSFAAGLENEGNAETTFVANRKNKVNANNGSAFGGNNIVNAYQGFATGANNIIEEGAGNSFIGGSGNKLKGENSFLTGSGNTIDGNNCFGVGTNSIINILSNQAGFIGRQHEIVGQQSFTAGAVNKNYSNQGIVLGLRNTGGAATKDEDGNYTSTTGTAVFVANLYNKALKDGASAFGYNNIADQRYQFVRGKFNDYTDTTLVDMVGWGTSDTKRQNIYTLDQFGTGWFKGGLKVGGLEQAEGKDVVLMETLYYHEIDEKYTSINEYPSFCLYEANGYENAPFKKCFILNQEKSLGTEIFEYSQYAFDFDTPAIAKRKGSKTYGDFRTEEWTLFDISVDIATPETAGIVKPINNIGVNENGEIDIKYQEWQDDDIDMKVDDVIYTKSPMFISYNNINNYEYAPFRNCGILSLPCDQISFLDTEEKYKNAGLVQVAIFNQGIKIRWVSSDTFISDRPTDWIEMSSQSDIDVIYNKITGNGYMIPNSNTLVDNVLTLENGQYARLGTYTDLQTLALAIPDINFSINTMYNSAFTLHCGETPPTLIYASTPIRWAGDDVSYDGVFTPEANKTYEVCVTFVDMDKEGNPIISARVGIV